MALSGNQKTGIGILGFIGRAYAAFVAKAASTVQPTPDGRNMYIAGKKRNIDIMGSRNIYIEPSKRNLDILD